MRGGQKILSDQLIVFFLAIVAALYFAYNNHYYLVISEVIIYLCQISAGRRHISTDLTLRRKVSLVGLTLFIVPVLLYISNDFYMESINNFNIDIDVFVGVIFLFFVYLLVLLNSLMVKKR